MIIRTRLCIQPICQSCRMPASTIGTPVRPRCQARKPAASSRQRSRRKSARCESCPIAGFCHSTLALNSCHSSSDRKTRSASPDPAAWAACQTCAGDSSPQCRCGDSMEVRSSPGVFRPVG